MDRPVLLQLVTNTLLTADGCSGLPPRPRNTAVVSALPTFTGRRRAMCMYRSSERNHRVGNSTTLRFCPLPPIVTATVSFLMAPGLLARSRRESPHAPPPRSPPTHILPSPKPSPPPPHLLL